MLNKRADKLELLRIAEAVALEKSIDKELIINSMETGIAKAAKLIFGQDNEIKVLINRDNGDIGIFRKLIIVEKPDNYDKIIRDLGGIDIFLLASGSSDGHVAFNNAYSGINQKTHITKLSMSTRTDNMKTFPQFNNFNEVPKFGLTVGLKTIFSLSKTAILVLVGKEKKQAFKKISSLKKFDKSWPASIIHKCKNNKIYIDKSVRF